MPIGLTPSIIHEMQGSAKGFPQEVLLVYIYAGKCPRVSQEGLLGYIYIWWGGELMLGGVRVVTLNKILLVLFQVLV